VRVFSNAARRRRDRRVERRDDPAAVLVHAPRDHVPEQLFLRTEVIVRERDLHARGLRDLAERHAVVAARGEQFLGRIEDAGLRRSAIGRCGGGRVGAHPRFPLSGGALRVDRPLKILRRSDRPRLQRCA
jgi:hypothetical protein